MPVPVNNPKRADNDSIFRVVHSQHGPESPMQPASNSDPHTGPLLLFVREEHHIATNFDTGDIFPKVGSTHVTPPACAKAGSEPGIGTWPAPKHKRGSIDSKPGHVKLATGPICRVNSPNRLFFMPATCAVLS